MRWAALAGAAIAGWWARGWWHRNTPLTDDEEEERE
jgi:hypothetical protein